MNSRYYTVEISKRGQLQTIVEMEKLSRVANFVTQSEQYRTKTHAECDVTIKACTVCAKESLTLEQFKVDNMDAIKRLALS